MQKIALLGRITTNEHDQAPTRDPLNFLNRRLKLITYISNF